MLKLMINSKSLKIKNPGKILVIRSGAIGDVIMTTPFLTNLRLAYPNASISYLVGDWSKSVLDNNPNVDEILSFNDEIITKKKLVKVLKLAKNLRKKQFDLCFILDKSWMWGLFAKVAGIKLRIGFSRGNEGRFHTLSIPFDGSKNEIDYNLKLLKKIGVKIKQVSPSLYSTSQDKIYAKKFIGSHSKLLKPLNRKIRKKIVGIAPGGASNPGQIAAIKRWPLDKYIDLLNLLQTKKEIRVLILGSKDENMLANQILSLTKNKQILNATAFTIQQTKELMELCDVIVTHDSGALHIASTTHSKIIALFGPTPSKRFAPKKSIVLKSKKGPYYDIYGKFNNANQDCMVYLSAKEVEKMVSKYLNK